ncbi:MAG: peptidylprolyl isomerase [Acidobacteria bacterium]|nr:peptidylprolyl isomerase [Acidobacteriota bacterium]
MDRKYIFASIAIVAVIIGGLAFVFSGPSADAEPLTTLTDADVEAIARSQEQLGDKSLVESLEVPEAKQAFLQGMKEHLALAAAAKQEGLDGDPLFKINRDYKVDRLLADMYEAKLGHSPNNPYPVAKEDIDRIFADANNASAFKRDMDALQKIQNDANHKMGTGIMPGVLFGESLERAKKSWARAKILSDQAKADAEFMASNEVKLRVSVLEAGLLSTDLLRKHWTERIRATDSEIAKFIATRPEYDLKRKWQKADEVLKRALAGESFAKLVAEFTEHRPTKATGGLIDNIVAGDDPGPVENALLAATPGKVLPQVVESELGRHILMLVKRTPKKLADGREKIEYSYRQILFQNKFEQPGVNDPEIPPPFMTAEEIARMIIEREKRDRLVAEYMAKTKIEVPGASPAASE